MFTKSCMCLVKALVVLVYFKYYFQCILSKAFCLQSHVVVAPLQQAEALPREAGQQRT